MISARRQPWFFGLLAGIFCLAGLLRLASNYEKLPQAYDEPAHLVCGMEWLDKGSFTLEPVHPPLPRVLAALGPYLDGSRLPVVRTVQAKNGEVFDIFSGGTDILNGRGHYRRTLMLARLGEIPLFCLGCALIFFWARSLLGNAGGAIAVGLFTLVPSVLAFAGIAYVDFSLAVFLPAMLWGFIRWLEKPTYARAATFGVAAGLAILSNFTVLLFGAVCLVVAFVCKLFANPSQLREQGVTLVKGLAVATAMLAFVIWAGYRFSVQPLSQTFQASAVKQLPGPAAAVGRKLLAWSPPLPAPAFFKGLVSAFFQNQSQPASYLLGEVRRGGYWYFYWLDLFMKTPLPILLFAIIGGCALARRELDWRWLALAGSVLAVLLASMTVKVSLGIRHILFVYPLLAILAALGVMELWKLRTRWPRALPVVTGLLAGWLLASSIRSQPDPISYYNELAGSTPERYFLFGCDFDCGQDVWRLSEELHRRSIEHWSGRIWSSADLSRMDLPSFDVLPPYQRASGWVAISVMHQLAGNGIWGARDVDGYRWLDSYEPVARVGRTIRLYYIQPDASAPQSGSRPEAKP